MEADSELIKILQRVCRSTARKRAISIGGGTYAERWTMASPLPGFPGQPELAHQPDEFISIGHLSKLMAIYADAISSWRIWENDMSKYWPEAGKANTEATCALALQRVQG